MTMRFVLTIAALALGTTGALAQMGPGGQFRLPVPGSGGDERLERQERGFDRGRRDLRDDDEFRIERTQRRDRDFDDRDFRRDDRDWDRRDRDRDRDWDRRGPYRGPVISFGSPGYFIRTLPEITRVIRYGGLPCRVTITRRVNYRGDIVESERRRCPGRPDVVITRR